MAKKFGGFPGGMDLKSMMKQAQKMQEEILKAQQEAESEVEAEASSGGGMVVAKANGKGELVSIKLEKDIIDPEEADMLQDLVIAACNEAIRKAKQEVQQRLEKVSPALSGLFNL